ncbi:MAG: phage holin family protein [Candidatus Uhrbacteria bacterium]|nr:phage holin family protein [Patescibacteria group bacterium]MBU1906965.1 phage holin family protein [Patescibacteria group bacterium]
MFLLLRWVVVSIALLGVAYLVPGFEVASFYIALLAALVLGLANAVVRPLIFILTLPVTIITLGLFTFVINALMLWLTASVVPGFEITGFVPAVMGAIILWLVGWVTNALIKQAKES